MAVYLCSYGISYLLARQQMYLLSGLVLFAGAVLMYRKDLMASGNLIDLRGLFFLAFTGGQGVSCLKLSRLQGDWSDGTWIAFLLFSVSFYLAYEFLKKRVGRLRGEGKTLSRKGWGRMLQEAWKGRGRIWRIVCGRPEGKFLFAMGLVTGASLLAFLFEAAYLGFIPMFSYGVPHAYSYFHVTGVHYFTVSCVLVPSMFVIYLSLRERGGALGRDRSFQTALLLTMLSLVIPLMCVSRFQMILAVILAAFTYISLNGSRSVRYLLVPALCLVPGYLLLTVLRSHSVEYLNGIFEMKNASTPIFITQPYMYIANNYDNFNCLVEQIGGYALGRRMLFPVWALTGLKFAVPSLVSFPLYVTKEELTTVTLAYDAYYDFGLLGMVFFGGILGIVCCVLEDRRKRCQNPVIHLFYAQVAIYMALSFFTTWFSNPATWFYFGVTGAVYLLLEVSGDGGS